MTWTPRATAPLRKVVVENQCTLVDRFLFVCCDNIVVPSLWRISLLYIWSIAWLSHSKIACLYHCGEKFTLHLVDRLVVPPQDCLLSLWRISVFYTWLLSISRLLLFVVVEKQFTLHLVDRLVVSLQDCLLVVVVEN